MTHNIPVNAPCVLVSEADLTMLLMKSKRVDELEGVAKVAQEDRDYYRTMYDNSCHNNAILRKEFRAQEAVVITLRSLLSDSVLARRQLEGEAVVLRQSMKDIGKALKQSGVSLTTLLTEPAVAPWNHK